MATVFKRGEVFWIQYRDGGVQHRESLRTSNRKVAEERRIQRELVLLRRPEGNGIPAPAVLAPVLPPVAVAEPEPPAPDLAAVRTEYAQWSTAHKRARTIRNDTSRLDHFFGFMKGKALAEIRTADVERFLTAESAKGRAPATMLRHREILHAFWRWALRQGYVERNVVSEIPRPRVPERDPRFLGLQDVEALLRAVEGSALGALVATAVFAGLRREELCWLTWADVDLDAPVPMLRVRAKTVEGESWEPKTKRDRKVPISPRLLAILRAYANAKDGRRAGWLFRSPEGCRWDPDNLCGRVRALLKRAGLSWNFLEMRHTFGSQLARKGVSLLKIARLMGNSPLIASRHYINLIPEEMASDVEF